ncbi:MAG: hypothetical protein QNJ44_23725 [Rhodobacter sp.]|nr:hypothetical protein [Rhodobacter sp.]
MSLFESTVLSAAGVVPGGEAAAAAETRANIFDMTRIAEDAVLRPRDTGPWSHPLRAALAARIARLNGENALAEHHMAAAGDFAALADPADDGASRGCGAVIAFMDKVAARTRDVQVRDITALQSAGIADADIVRLAELNAFLAYQLRVIAGLRLMRTGG